MNPFQENNDDKSVTAPISTTSEIQQLRDQLEQQALQTREALFQLMQVREQLISETNARIEAQVRNITNIISFLVVFGWPLFFSKHILNMHFSNMNTFRAGKNATVVATKSGVTGAFGIFGWLYVHGK